MDLIPEITFFISTLSRSSASMSLLASASGQVPSVMSTTSLALDWRWENEGRSSRPVGSAAAVSSGNASPTTARIRRFIVFSCRGPARYGWPIQRNTQTRSAEGAAGLGWARSLHIYVCGAGIGRDGEIRTRDPLHPMQVRYQAAPRPDGGHAKHPCSELQSPFAARASLLMFK